jgi:hypothetical protein
LKRRQTISRCRRQTCLTSGKFSEGVGCLIRSPTKPKMSLICPQTELSETGNSPQFPQPCCFQIAVVLTGHSEVGSRRQVDGATTEAFSGRQRPTETRRISHIGLAGID